MIEKVLPARELGGYCLLSCTKVLRMGPAGGLHVDAMLATSWEGGVACAHSKDDFGQGETTIPQDVTPLHIGLVRLVDTSQPYMAIMMVMFTPEAILVTVCCKEGWEVEAG